MEIEVKKDYDIDYYFPINIDNSIHDIVYYFTSNCISIFAYENRDIVNKITMKTILSSDDMSEDLDIYILKNDFVNNSKPKNHDIIEFVENKTFYEVLDINDDNKYYIINIKKYKTH